MFKPFYGQCPFCPPGTKRLIAVKKGYCKEHNASVKGKVSKPIQKTAIKKRFKKPTGEYAMFIEIWNERPHYSEVSGRYLGDEMNVQYMSHILSKGAYPGFRLNPDNIMLKTAEEHAEWEFGNTDHPMWDKVKEKKEQLKYKYYNDNKY